MLKCGARELDLVKEYATHDFDAVLNMYYAKARFYDADNRRFVAVDPILDPGQYDLREYVTDSMQMVQYLYVKDNVVNWNDVLGLYYLFAWDNGTRYTAVKQSELDAVIQSLAYNLSYQTVIRAFRGAEVVGGSSYKDPDDVAFMKDVVSADVSNYIDQVIVPQIAAYNPYAAAVSFVSNFGETIWTVITTTPKYWAIADRDDIIWKVFKETGITPESTSMDKLSDAMMHADAYVSLNKDYFTKWLTGLRMSGYTAGKRIANGEEDIIMDRLYIEYVKEDDFLLNPSKYIDNAYEKSKNDGEGYRLQRTRKI